MCTVYISSTTLEFADIITSHHCHFRLAICSRVVPVLVLFFTFTPLSSLVWTSPFLSTHSCSRAAATIEFSSPTVNKGCSYLILASQCHFFLCAFCRWNNFIITILVSESPECFSQTSRHVQIHPLRPWRRTLRSLRVNCDGSASMFAMWKKSAWFDEKKTDKGQNVVIKTPSITSKLISKT